MKTPSEGILRPDQVQALVQPYGLSAKNIEFLRCSQNHVYSVGHDGGKCIVRISKGRHRTQSQVGAELAWIEFLTASGIKACKPIPTRSGEACATLNLDGEPCVVACFEHAPGKSIAPQDICEPLYEKLGILLGRMHTRTMALDVAQTALGRPHWHESRLLREDVTSIAKHLSPKFVESVSDLMRDLQQLPRSPATYGLIHGDVSFGNCFLDQEDLWIFDFDNCEHGCFIQDLATVLYDSIYCKVLQKFADPRLNDRIAPRWTAFWKGYTATGPLKQIEPLRLKQFFLLREAVIYIHYHRVLDVSAMEELFKAGLAVMRSNVENQEHQVDFTQLSGVAWQAGRVQPAAKISGTRV